MASELAAALAKFQAALPSIAKAAKGAIRNGKPDRYADLADVTKVVMPLLGQFGLSFTACPTMNSDGQFGLLYALRHTGDDESIGGFYPLGTGSPQQIGSAITYARRYCLCAVTGVVADEDDDGQAAGAAQRGGNGRASAWGSDAEYERSVTGPPEGTVEEHARTQRTRGPVSPDEDRWAGRDAAPLTPPEDVQGGIDGKQQARMFALFAECGLAGRDDDQRDWLSGTLSRLVASRKSLTWKEADQAVKALAELATRQKLPGSADAQQVGAIASLYASKLGYKRTERAQMLAVSEQIIGRSLEGPDGERTHQNLSAAEARKLHDTLDGFPDRAGLEDWLKSPAEAGLCEPQNVPPADALSPPAHAAPPVPQSVGGAHHPGPAPSGHPAADEAATGPGPAERASSGQRSTIDRKLADLGIEDPEERLGVLSRLVGFEVDSLADLTPAEAKQAAAALKGCHTYADLVKLTATGDKPGSDG